MRPTRLFLAALGLAATLAGTACDEKLSDVAGPTPNLVPTFSSIQQEIFNTTDSSGRLACIGCHTDAGRTPAGGLVLLDGRSYQALVGQASRFKTGAIFVVPGNPDASYLIHKLEGAADMAGSRMPRGTGPFLTSGQMQIIRRWIELGAKND
jgi:cytochrome c553